MTGGIEDMWFFFQGYISYNGKKDNGLSLFFFTNQTRVLSLLKLYYPSPCVTVSSFSYFGALEIAM